MRVVSDSNNNRRPIAALRRAAGTDRDQASDWRDDGFSWAEIRVALVLSLTVTLGVLLL